MSSSKSKLPPELWSKILLQAKLSLEELFSVATVCRQFYSIIFNELFLRKCGLNFAHPRNCFENAIPISQNGLQCENAALYQRQVFIEANPIFGHTLKFDSSKRSSEITSKFVLNQKITCSNSFSISFWFLLTNDDKNLQTIEFNFEDTPTYSTSSDSDTLTFDIVNGGAQIDFECCGRRERCKMTHKDASLAIGQWYHFAMVYSHKDKSKVPVLKLYQDWKELYECKNFKISLSSKDYFKIYTRISAMTLADIALWSRELIPLELKAIYQQRTSLDKVNLIQSLLAMNHFKDEVSYF
jgi:hypothetical protein